MHNHTFSTILATLLLSYEREEAQPHIVYDLRNTTPVIRKRATTTNSIEAFWALLVGAVGKAVAGSSAEKDGGDGTVDDDWVGGPPFGKIIPSIACTMPL